MDGDYVDQQNQQAGDRVATHEFRGGGMVIGIMQQGLSFAEAGHAYTLLSVGDGLVTQVPALIVSIAAGLLVSKAGVAGAADKAHDEAHFGGERTAQRLDLLGEAVAAATRVDQRQQRVAELDLEVVHLQRRRHRLFPLLSQFSGYPKALGMSAAVMLVMALLPGIPMIPFVALGGGTAALAYVIDRRRKRSAAADDAKKAETEKTAPTGQFMVMDPTGKQVTLPGVHTTEPTFGLPATWIEASLKEEASVKGYTVVDSATVLATHLTELIKANMSELLSYGEELRR